MMPVTVGCDLIACSVMGKKRASQPGKPEPASQKGPEGRVFNVFCNGKAVVRGLNILREVGTNRPLLRTIAGLEPNAQGKLLLEFEPVKGYATLTAIELLPQ